MAFATVSPATGGGFRRSIGLWRATSMVVGIIVGASIFLQSSEVTTRVPTVSGALFTWGAAGFLTLIGALVIAELSSAWPKSGGVYVYLRDAYAPWLGFLWGWAMIWSMHSGIIAAISVGFARYTGTFIPLGDWGTRGVAIAAIIVLSAVNYLGVRQGSALQAALTLIKVVALVLIIAVGFAFAEPLARAVPIAVSGGAPPEVTTRGVLLALVAGLFAFGGWHMVSYTAEETVNPTRTIPRALLIGTLAVTVLYILVNAAYFRVLSVEAVAQSTRVAADFASAVVGAPGARIVAALVMISTLGAANGVILAGPRVYQAMAADGLIFKRFAAVHPKYGTPHLAIVLQAVVACTLVATAQYGVLFRRVVYTEWLFFALVAAALFILRRRPGYAPAWRIWGYPVLPAIFIVSSLAIVVNQLISDPRESAIGLAIVLAGLPVYLLWSRTRNNRSSAS